MTGPHVSRRSVLKGGLSVATMAGLPLGGLRHALAATEEERIIAAAKGAGSGDVTGMIWSLYYRNFQRIVEEFKQEAGIGVSGLLDISIFDIPARSMAEALSRSPEFDLFHVDSNMIPSLASAGLLEPLDEYMEKAGFTIDAVGNFGTFMRYKDQTYGLPTDGNVHIQGIRKDLFENPDERKKFADMNGKELAWPETWEDYQELIDFFHRPDDKIYGGGSLKNRGNGATWWYMMFYSAGGFPFDDDMNPTLNTPAGQYAVEVYLKQKSGSHPEAPGWGTPQMIPQWVNGHIAAGQYWNGIIPATDVSDKSPTKDQWLWGLVPGSRLSGKLVHRSVSSPLAALLVNRHSPRKARAAYLALYLSTLKHSTEICAHTEWTFHDPWHVGHFRDNPDLERGYTRQGLDATERNLLITTPPIYMTGLLEFQDVLAKNLSEAYVGQLPEKEVLTRTESEWGRVIRTIGQRRLRDELASYKAVMPHMDVPPA